MAGRDLDDVRAALAEFEPGMFTSRMILERVPWIFSSRDQFLSWKQELAKGLGVDPHSIIVVGSACTGVTLNPAKEPFRAFQPDSDIDVAVVSAHHFDIAWAALRDIGRIGGSIPTKFERKIRRQHKAHLIFNGTIATDKILNYLPFKVEWRQALDEASYREPTQGKDIRVRIYRNIESLRIYHERNVAALKESHTRDMTQSLVLEDDSEIMPLIVDEDEGDIRDLIESV